MGSGYGSEEAFSISRFWQSHVQGSGYPSAVRRWWLPVLSLYWHHDEHGNSGESSIRNNGYENEGAA
jgi:hypothetical protein